MAWQLSARANESLLLQEQLQVPVHNNDEVVGKYSEFNVFSIPKVVEHFTLQLYLKIHSQ